MARRAWGDKRQSTMTGLAWRARGAVVCMVMGLTASAQALGGCARGQSESCSVDADCGAGRVCRDAACRSPCMSSHWVGEPVEVSSGKAMKQAEIAPCEQRQYWVRYASGVEEQVYETRLLKRAVR